MKTFEKVPAVRRRHGSKAYEYGYVWLLLPPECIGKTAVVKVYVLEEGERPPAQPQPQPAQPQPRPQPPQPRPAPHPTPRPAQPQPALPRPLTQLRPQPQPPRPPSAPLPPVSPELDTLLRSLRPQPGRAQLLPFEEFTLGEEEKEEEEKRRRKWLFGWP